MLLRLLGRKLTILTSGALFLVSFLCIGLSSLARSHVMLLVFRVMSGCAVGIAVPSVRWVMLHTSVHHGKSGNQLFGMDGCNEDCWNYK